MYVDKNLVFCENADMRASVLIPGVGEYLFVSDTIDLGTGTRGLPYDAASLVISCDTTFAESTPPCILTVRLISGATPGLLADIVGATYSLHYQTIAASASFLAGQIKINSAIPNMTGQYQRYLGLFLAFSGGGLDSGAITCYMADAANSAAYTFLPNAI